MGVRGRDRRATARLGAALAAVLALTAGVTLIARKPGGVGPAAPPSASRPEPGGLPRLEAIPPGTRLGSGPPPGWTHLVVKSIPRLVTGDLGSLPAAAGSTAGLIRTLILAEVRGGTLRRVGVGLCVPDRGGEVVASTATQAELGLRLSWIGRRVLDRGGRDLARSRLVARTPTLAVLESPSRLVVDGRHRDVWVRHALLAGPGDDLTWCIWAVEDGPGDRRLVSPPVELRPGHDSDCGLDVAAERVLGAVPVNWSFAMKALPAGRPLPMTKVAREQAEAGGLTGLDAARFEGELRTAVRLAAGRAAPLARRHVMD